jgi:hypothetical protein
MQIILKIKRSSIAGRQDLTLQTNLRTRNGACAPYSAELVRIRSRNVEDGKKTMESSDKKRIHLICTLNQD